MDGWMNEWPWRGSIFIRSFRSGKISGSVSLLICMFLFHCALSLECPWLRCWTTSSGPWILSFPSPFALLYGGVLYFKYSIPSLQMVGGKKNIVGGISNLFTSRWRFLFVWLTLKREKKMFIYLFIYCIHLEFNKTFIVQFSSGTLVNINNAIMTKSTENKLTLLPWLH